MYGLKQKLSEEEKYLKDILSRIGDRRQMRWKGLYDFNGQE